MLRLDNTTRKLEILLGGVVASTQLAFAASWSDATPTGYTGGATPGVTNDTSPVTIVDAPGSGAVRDIDYISVNNRDTFAAVVTIQYNDNGTVYPVLTVTLAVGSQLVYTHGNGWNVMDSSGSFKTGVTGPSGETGSQGPIGPAVYLVGEDGEDGLDGAPGKHGTNGLDGSTGPIGPAGPAVFLAAEDPEEPMQGPPGMRGDVGATGNTGAQGPAGPAVFLAAEDPDDGEIGAPGRAGVDGATGAQGPVGPVVMWDHDEPEPSMLGGGVGSTATVPSGGSLTLGTAQSTTSGTSINFTGIPAWVKRVTVSFSGISTNGSSNMQILLGDSGGVETTGYNGVLIASAASTQLTTGVLLIGSSASFVTLHGQVSFTLLDPATNLWSFTGISGRGDSVQYAFIGGSKALSAVLDRVQLTTVNGTDTFDAGSVNILYE